MYTLGPGLLCKNFAYYAFEQCSKNFPILLVLNIMLMNLRNMPLLTGTNDLTLLLEYIS